MVSLAQNQTKPNQTKQNQTVKIYWSSWSLYPYFYMFSFLSLYSLLFITRVLTFDHCMPYFLLLNTLIILLYVPYV